MSFYVYVLRCSDGRYYVGHTDDLEKRLAAHQIGEISGFTQSRRPVRLLFAEEFPSREDAFLRERQIKGWSRAKKEALIRGNWTALRELSHARGSTSSPRAAAESPLVLSPSKDEPTQTAASPPHPLVRLARQAVEAYVLRGQTLHPDPPGEELPPRAGCFVSIKTRDGALRGCVGTIEPTEPTLAQEVVRNAIHSASRDPRFLPITPEELPDLVYSIDVLSPPEPIEGPHQLDPRRYGVIVQSGARRGLLLPDLEGVDSVEQQVAIAMSKALIDPDEPVQLWRFEVKRYT